MRSRMIKYTASAVILLASFLFYFIVEKKFDAESIRSKRALITGGSQNIGRQIAFEFAKLGANVVVTARNKKHLEEVVQICKQLGANNAYYIVADMGQLDQTEKVIKKAVELLGGLDYLVLNHVYSYKPGFWNASHYHFENAHKSSIVNYLSYIHLSTHAAPHLSKRNGHLVVVSSLAGYIYTTQQTVYGATKAALNHFYSDLRLEMALLNQKSYSISICLLGAIATEDSRWEKYPTKLKVKGYPMNETAMEIIIGSTKKKAYVFIPGWTVITSLLRAIPTDYFDNMYLNYLYKTS